MDAAVNFLLTNNRFEQSELVLYAVVDKQGNSLHANPFLQKLVIPYSRQSIAKARSYFVAEDQGRFESLLVTCIDLPHLTQRAELALRGKDGIVSCRWEIQYQENGHDDSGHFHLVGTILPDSRLPERYQAYEMGTQGIWMLELVKPIATNTPKDQLLRHVRNEAFMAECNDTMAQMYGFDRAAELIGMKLDDFMDFEDPIRVHNLYRFIDNGFKSYALETKEFDREGNTLYFLNNMNGIVIDGQLLRIWGTQQNITDQRIAEQKMVKSELFYRNLITDSLDGILLTDENGVISFASPSVQRILGFSMDDLDGRSAFEFVHPDDQMMAIRTFGDEVKMDPTVKFISVRLLRKDGTWTWCIVRGHNMLHNPYIGKIGIYFYDDTIRKQTEKALSDSEKKLRRQATILTNVTDMIITTDLDLNITSWNKVSEELTGIAESEVLGKPAHGIIDYNFSPLTIDQVLSILFDKGEWRGEMYYTHKNGEKVHVWYTVSILKDEEGKHIGLLGVGKTITERKKAEEKLSESEIFYRNLIAHSLDGIVLTDEKGFISYGGPSVKTLTGYEPGELIGRNIFEFVHPEDKAIAREAFMLELNGASVQDYILVRIKNSEGNWFWCSARSHNLLSNSTFHSMAIYFTDDTRRKEIEDRLRKSEEQFRSLIFNLKQGIVSLDPDRTMVICNTAATVMLGLSESEIRGSAPIDPRWHVVHEDGRHYPLEELPYFTALATKKPVRDVVIGVYRPKTSDRVWLLASAEPVVDSENVLINVICSFTDITEQKRLAQELIEQEIQKQKQLTQATIDGQEKERQEIGKELHDNINQHLNTTRLYLEVALEKADGETLEMIALAHKNLTGIVNEIRQLSQSLVPPTLGDLGLVESVQELCDSLRMAHAFSVDFMYRHFDEEGMPDNMKLMLFRIAQEQVNNIVRHAHAGSIQIKLQADAEHVILTIADDGVGFDPHHLKKGLGFKNISSRAALFNGLVEIETSPGNGCSISVTVPLITEH